MAYTPDELRAIKTKETLDFHGITKWHEMGYKGQGINYLELENEDSGHGINVVDTYDDVDLVGNPFLHGYRSRSSGDVCLYFEINVNGKYIDLAKFVEDNEIHIIGLSTSGSMAKPAEEYLKKLDVILVASAGNDSGAGVTATLKNVAINTGAIKLVSGAIKLENYSANGDNKLHFTTLHGFWGGTSFAQPTLAGIIALIMSRYGIISQEKMIEVLKSICLDAGEYGYDTSFGWGVPILPEAIDMLENYYTGRFGHLKEISCLKGQKLKKGDRFAKIGNTGISYGTHLDMAFVYGEYDYFSYTDIENGKFMPNKTALDKWTSDKLFNYGYEITTDYCEEGYKEIYAGGKYEHYGRDLVPEDRHETNEHYYIHAVEDCVVLDVGYNDSLGNYVVLGVDEDMGKFKDVSEDRWSYDLIEEAEALGLINGMYKDVDNDGVVDLIFNPSGNLTREQGVALIMRVYKKLKEELS